MMAASGSEGPYVSQQTATIIDILLAYGSRGGGLYAAYRHPDNPLLLTHVRWQAPTGEVMEARRSPDDVMMVREEREAWAQVALRSATLRPDTVGPNAPWLQAPLDPREAYDLASRAQRAREASMPPSQHLFAGAVSSGGGVIPSGGPAPSTPRSHGTPPALAPLSAPGYFSPQRESTVDAHPVYESYDSYGGQNSGVPEGSQITGVWPRGSFRVSESQPDHEIIVIACIEVEMPSLMPGTPQDFTRDFARDVAVNFNRAAHTIPQTRETRGWMSGSHMTLGALMALGTGSRPASRVEMEHAAETLADALARRTLPYVRLRFADAPEWAQGVPLPE